MLGLWYFWACTQLFGKGVIVTFFVGSNRGAFLGKDQINKGTEDAARKAPCAHISRRRF